MGFIETARANVASVRARELVRGRTTTVGVIIPSDADMTTARRLFVCESVPSSPKKCP